MSAQPIAFTMTARANRLRPKKPSQPSTESSANTRSIAAITRTIVWTGAGQLILFGEYFSQ